MTKALLREKLGAWIVDAEVRWVAGDKAGAKFLDGISNNFGGQA